MSHPERQMRAMGPTALVKNRVDELVAEGNRRYSLFHGDLQNDGLSWGRVEVYELEPISTD